MSHNIFNHFKNDEPPGKFLNNHIKPPHRNIKSISGLNSHIVESLTEMVNHKITLEDIHEILLQHAVDNIDLFENIRKEGISHVPTAITLLLIDESIRNLKIRRILITRLIKGEALLVLPLPPHLSDFLLTLASQSKVFTCDMVMPPHLKYSDYRYIGSDVQNEILQNFEGMKSIAIEGYTENNRIYARSNSVELIRRVENLGLEEIFVHIIPHLPPHCRFDELQIAKQTLTIYKI